MTTFSKSINERKLPRWRRDTCYVLYAGAGLRPVPMFNLTPIFTRTPSYSSDTGRSPAPAR